MPHSALSLKDVPAAHNLARNVALRAANSPHGIYVRQGTPQADIYEDLVESGYAKHLDNEHPLVHRYKTTPMGILMISADVLPAAHMVPNELTSFAAQP